MSAEKPHSPDRPAEPLGEPMGGEPACMLDRVCPECGRLADTAPPTTCGRCGATVGDPD